jgi:hypothetical protein
MGYFFKFLWPSHNIWTLNDYFNFVWKIEEAIGYKMALEIFGKVWLSIIKVEASKSGCVVDYGVRD